MMIAVFILLSIPVGYLMGGKLSNVKNYTTRALGLPIAAFLLEAAAPYLARLLSAPIGQWYFAVVLAEYLMLFVFCAVNRKTRAIWVIFAACLMNFFVIVWFGFRMPVTPYARELPAMAQTIAKIDSGEYFRYTVANITDSFWYLGDVIMIPVQRIGGFASIGDLLLGLGCGWLFCDWMRTEKTPPQQEPAPRREKDAA